MYEPVDIEVVRAEALRKLGRNVVNLSKIEAGFKYLILVSKFQGNEKTTSEQLSRNQTRLQKQTLGKLVQEFNKNVLGDSSQSEPTTDFPGTGISHSFRITYNNPDSVKAQKRALSNIVAERNKLIHQDLALLDTSSVEDYRKLISLLDEQNSRLIAQLEELIWIIESLQKGWKVFEDLFKSPEFLQYIQSSQADNNNSSEREH